MKIAMLGTKGLPSRFGGIETHVTELATRLARMNHEVVAYVRPWYVGKNSSSSFNGVRLIRLPSLVTKHTDAASHTFISVVHALLIERPDVYHFHGVGPALFAFLPRVFAPHAKTVVTFHCVDRRHAKWGAFARFMLWLGEKAALIFPHETIAVSKTLVEYTENAWHARSTYIPNGITPRRVSLDPALLDPFTLQPYRYALMVSRLVQHKGAHTLIAAWQKARDLDPILMKNMKLAIAGDSAFTDEYVAQLRAQTVTDPSIVMTGYQSGESLQALFMGASFVVHPSQSEGLPIAVLEAMSYGKAVIGSDIPENMELLAESGVPVPVGDTNALANAILDLVRDPMQASALGRLSREIVESDYHWDDIAKKTVSLYGNEKRMPVAVLALR